MCIYYVINILETDTEVESVEDAGNMINNSIDKLKKIIGDIMMMSGDPPQVQLIVMLLAVILELIFTLTILLCRYR